MNKIFYNPKLKELARKLRNNSTKAEIKLWNYLKRKQLKGYDFHRQKPVDNYIVDFFCNKLLLAIELDGYTHGFEDVFEKDEVKAQRLRKLGITILRFTDDDVMNNIDSVLRSIQELILCFEERQKLHTP
jgi:very-short-patch-repair endonuclease